MKNYAVTRNAKPSTLHGFKHWHGERPDWGHRHLVGGPALYVDWQWSVLDVIGDHYHEVPKGDAP